MLSRAYWLVILNLVYLMAGCSTPNLFLGSECHTGYRFVRGERVTVGAISTPTPSETSLQPHLVQALKTNGFVVVDNPNQAGRILGYRFADTINFTTQVSTTNQSGKIEIEENREGYAELQLIMLDMDSLRAGSNVVVWNARVITQKELFQSTPEAVIAKVLSLYGKNKVTQSSFQAPSARHK